MSFVNPIDCHETYTRMQGFRYHVLPTNFLRGLIRTVCMFFNRIFINHLIFGSDDKIDESSMLLAELPLCNQIVRIIDRFK